MDGIALVDGQLVSVGEAKIPLLDWGFLRSDACQDTVSVWDGAFFRLDDHVDRFLRSCANLRLVPPERGALIDALKRLVAASGLRRAYVQMIMTRGLAASGSRDPRTCINRFMAFCVPFITIAPSKSDGLRVHISNRSRIPQTSVPSDIKNYHWIDFELAIFDAIDAGFDTTLLLNGDGNLTEGPGFNIFAVSGGTLLTPGENVLEGVTRRTVIELAADVGIPCEVGPVAPRALREANEAFACSTAGGIVPIFTIDHHQLGDGKAGPVTTRLKDEYWQRREAGWLGTPIDYERAVPALKTSIDDC